MKRKEYLWVFFFFYKYWASNICNGKFNQQQKLYQIYPYLKHISGKSEINETATSLKLTIWLDTKKKEKGSSIVHGTNNKV